MNRIHFHWLQEGGFTLIELLIVISIMGILATITTARLLTALDQTRRSETTVFIGKLELAISLYHIDTGYYPPDVNSSASLRSALNPSQEETNALPPGWDGPYVEFKDHEVDPEGFLMDPWYTDKSHRNNIYVYSANTTTGAVTGAPFHNRTSFDLYSIGSDGKTGHDALPANEFSDGNYCQNGLDDDGDSLVDELSTTEDNNGYLEDDINNW